MTDPDSPSRGRWSRIGRDDSFYVIGRGVIAKAEPTTSLLARASAWWHELTRPPYKRSAPVEDTIVILDFDGPAQYGPHTKVPKKAAAEESKPAANTAQ